MFRRIRKTGTAPASVQLPAPEPAAVAPNEAPAAASLVISGLASPPRANSKLGIVLGLLQAPEGASLARLAAVTDWQSHTTRAALAGLRKRGYVISHEKVVAADGAKCSVYRITAGPAQ